MVQSFYFSFWPFLEDLISEAYVYFRSMMGTIIAPKPVKKKTKIAFHHILSYQIVKKTLIPLFFPSSSVLPKSIIFSHNKQTLAISCSSGTTFFFFSATCNLIEFIANQTLLSPYGVNQDIKLHGASICSNYCL